MTDKPICIGCGKHPDELPEYQEDDELTPDEYCIQEEGTYNPRTGHFACTSCYIKMGMPTLPGGWRAP
jgi:hypothetical protein